MSAAWRVIFSVALGLQLASCSVLGFGQTVQVEHPQTVSRSGVVVQELLPGIGPAAGIGDRLTIDYNAFLEDGSRVDSTSDRGQPLSFELGSAPIVGWNEGLLAMRPGGRRRVVVPPDLAYGTEGVPNLIPPDATLIFDVELVDIEERATAQLPQ